MDNCPCDSGSKYDVCCRPIIEGAPAPTADALMRSRYSAYVKHAFTHLHSSLSRDQKKDYSGADAERWSKNSEWIRLQILNTHEGGPNDESGLVEFTARFKTAGQEHEHHETAIFKKEDHRWVYAGQVMPQGIPVKRDTPKVGRNDPCTCGSGKKFKKCCGIG